MTGRIAMVGASSSFVLWLTRRVHVHVGELCFHFRSVRSREAITGISFFIGTAGAMVGARVHFQSAC